MNNRNNVIVCTAIIGLLLTIIENIGIRIIVNYVDTYMISLISIYYMIITSIISILLIGFLIIKKSDANNIFEQISIIVGYSFVTLLIEQVVIRIWGYKMFLLFLFIPTRMFTGIGQIMYMLGINNPMLLAIISTLSPFIYLLFTIKHDE